MIVLALDTATREGSVALLIGDTCHARRGDPSRTHGERLPRELLDLLAAHQLTVEAVDLLAIVAGPGSFTGLRVGMATVQGLALAARKRVVPIPTLEALVASRAPGTPAAGTELVVPCLDGQRGDVFYAAFETGAGRADDTGRWPARLPPAVGRPEHAVAELGAVLGDEAAVLIGSGAERYADALLGGLRDSRIEPVSQPLAAAAARLAAVRAQEAVVPHALAPIYIRRPDAELARDRHRRGTGSGDDPPVSVERVSGRESLVDIEALQRDAFHRGWTAAELAWELDHSRVARLYVARTSAGEVVAYCACWVVADELHINNLAVARRWRRRGVASRLLFAVARESVDAGATSATLEVRESNEAARRLYEGLGFRVEGVRRDYYRQPREDALILWHRDLARLARP